VLGHLGPEPFSREFTAHWLHTALHTKKRQLKPLLLDQTFLAGLGNIYTDEALHRAKLHPVAASDSVTAKQAEALHEAIRKVLKEGIRRNGASIDWAYRGGQFQNYFRVYDREGTACPVCGTEIQKIIVGQRGTHVCPNCQTVR
jgi:formamidopyrimidine-DNA glycosylase